jgi:hypothetical protein
VAGRARELIGTAAAAVLAAGYVITAPPSRDLSAHLFDAQLFGRIGFAPWDTLWYGGHSPLAYSVLFPALASWLTPQLVAALAAVGTAALLERLVHRHLDRGRRDDHWTWPVAGLLAAATATDLYTGRLALAAGALPATVAIVALDGGGRRGLACAVAWTGIAALFSPLAAALGAIVAAGIGLGAAWEQRRLGAGAPGLVVALAALAAVAALTVAFGEPGVEPFGLATLLPVLAVCIAALILLERDRRRLRAVVGFYGLMLVVAFVIPSAVGSNAARLGTLAAAPLGALVAADRRWAAPVRGLILVALLYIGWQAPVSDVLATAGDPAVGAAYYRPLLTFLSRRWAQEGPFRVEIPFTASHWESLWVARRFPLARGWERQLDEADNPLFYRPGLTAATYRRWLMTNGVRYVALPDAALDPSAREEARIIDLRPGFLRPALRTTHWRIDAVVPAPGLTRGAATVTGLGPTRVRLLARRPGSALVAVRFTPYWRLSVGAGCVAAGPNGMTRVWLRRAGPATLTIAFALGRVGASGPRCTGSP